MVKIGPKFKIAKRLNASIFEKTQTKAFMLSKERSAKNKRGRRGNSDYQRQLIEKQKLRLTYGLSERQFSNYVAVALASKVPQAALFIGLETRLDSIIYRMGLTPTRRAARQMVSHGHITVNGRRTTIPSQKIHKGDVIAVREGSRQGSLFGNLAEKLKEHKMPSWVSFDASKMEGTLTADPASSDQDSTADIGAVFEFYTR